jgi:hypothetical protein
MLALIINDYRKLNKIGHPIRAKNRWTNSFFIKFVLCFYISINYLSLTIQFDPGFQYPFFLSILWIIICWNLTFEFIRKVPQHWLCLRLFWFINGLQFLFADLILILLKYKDITQNYLNNKEIFFLVVQSIPSFFLMILGLFKPNDNDENQYITQDEKLIVNNEDIEEDKQICTIELTITEIKNDAFEIKNNVLIPINDKNNNNDIQNNNISEPILRFHLVLNQNKSYTIKKHLNELIQLNNSIIENYDNEDDFYSNISKDIIDELKELTLLFTNNQLKEFKLKEMQEIYIKIMTNYPHFVNDFLHFCEITDEKLIDGIRMHYEKKNSNYSFKSTSSVLSLSQLKSNNSKFNKSDVNKIIDFIVNIISNNELKIRTTILKIDEENIECEFNYQNNNYLINIALEKLFLFMKNNLFNKVENIIELNQFLQNPQNILDLKENDDEKKNYLQNSLDNIINDLFFYDNTFYKMFLKTILIMESDSIDNLILNNFFSLDNYDDTKFDTSIFSEKTNIKIKLYFKSKIKNDEYSFKIESNEGILNSSFNLKHLQKNCNQIIQINSNSRIPNLNKPLNQIIKIINEKDEVSKIIDILNDIYEKKNFYVFYNPYFRQIFRIGEINSEKNNDISNNSIDQSYISRGDISIDDQNKSMIDALIS